MAVLCLGVGLLSGLGVAQARAEDQPPFDLLGDWYVLVHYRDADTPDPQADRWEDKVWSFARRGSRLVWTEYPVLSFRDDRGRSETLASGRRVRSPGRWKPNARQREEIDDGLGIVAQWTRSKTLRGDDASGYRSRGAVNRESASVLGYSERWEIEAPTGEPVFRRVDEMSGTRAVALEGAAEYRSRSWNGTELEGSFVRDASQQGSFSMRRTGPVHVSAGAGDE